MNTLINLTGKRFGKLVVREKLPPRKDKRTRWLCDCDCGNSCVAYSYALRKKNQTSCGCGKLKDIIGARFGHLVVLKRSNQYIDTTDRGKKYLWNVGAIAVKPYIGYPKSCEKTLIAHVSPAWRNPL